MIDEAEMGEVIVQRFCKAEERLFQAIKNGQLGDDSVAYAMENYVNEWKMLELFNTNKVAYPTGPLPFTVGDN